MAAPAAFFVLKIVGAGYLLWLAYQALRHGGGIRVAQKAPRAPSVLESYLTGVGINLLNPKVVLFFITFVVLSFSKVLLAQLKKNEGR